MFDLVVVLGFEPRDSQVSTLPHPVSQPRNLYYEKRGTSGLIQKSHQPDYLALTILHYILQYA